MCARECECVRVRMLHSLMVPGQAKGANTLTDGSTPHQGNACWDNTFCHLAAVCTAVSGEQQVCTLADANLPLVLLPLFSSHTYSNRVPESPALFTCC